MTKKKFFTKIYYYLLLTAWLDEPFAKHHHFEVVSKQKNEMRRSERRSIGG